MVDALISFLPSERNPSYSSIAAFLCYAFFVNRMFFSPEIEFQATLISRILAMFSLTLGIFHCHPVYFKIKALFWTALSAFLLHSLFFGDADDLLKIKCTIASLLAVGFWSRCRNSLTLENIVSSAALLNFLCFTFFPDFSMKTYAPSIELKPQMEVAIRMFGVFNFCIARFCAVEGCEKVKAIMFTFFGLFFSYYAFVMRSDATSLGFNTNIMACWAVIHFTWAHTYWARCGELNTPKVAKYLFFACFVLFTFYSCFARRIYFPEAGPDGTAKKQLCLGLKLYGMFMFSMFAFVSADGYNKSKLVYFTTAAILFLRLCITNEGQILLKNIGANLEMMALSGFVCAFISHHYYTNVDKQSVVDAQHVLLFGVLIGAVAFYPL